MLFAVTLIKLVAEVALLSLLGKWVLQAWLLRLSPGRWRSNPVMWLLDTLCRPFVGVVGWAAPRLVPPQHHSLVAFLVLMFAWVGTTVVKIALCLDTGVAACR